jgi:quinoprotein glucose dehydrogenase
LYRQFTVAKTNSRDTEMMNATRQGHATSLFAKILGALVLALGLPQALGGVYLLYLGGSFFYVVNGLGLVIAGIYLFRGKSLGAIVYALVFALTVAWSFVEADGSVWALVPRLLGSSIFMVAVLVLAPTLDKPLFNRPAAYAATSVLLLAGVAIAYLYGDATRHQSMLVALPPQGAVHSDPSPLTSGSDWPAYGGSYAARRASPLNQITPDNVDLLERAWLFNTGDMPEGDPADSKYSAQNTPLKVGDNLYLCTATNILIALNPGTGEEKWRYDPIVSDDYIPYSAACRGVAYFEVIGGIDQPAGQPIACATRIIAGTLDGRLIAVDAKTGRPCAGFGQNGEASIVIGMGTVEPGMVSMTSAPTIIQGVIVTGHQVKDGVSINAPSGVLQGFDAVTGEHLWAWDMEQPELTGRPDNGEFSRGTPNMWTTASGDEELGYVYMPMGNSAGDYLSSDRSETENTYSTALVALDVNTGKPVWHFRTVDIDVWDYDLGSQATLVDFPMRSGAGLIPALILSSKQGDIYVLDRRTGEPITDVVTRSVPGGGVEPDERSPTQPFSAYHTLAKAPLSEKDMWGMSQIDQMICRIQYRRASYDGIYTAPTSDRRWIQYPGYNGGSDWGGITVDTARGIVVANYNDMPNYNRLIPRAVADELLAGQESGSHASLAAQAGAPYAVDVNAGWRMPITGLLCKEPPYGGIRAFDLASGETLWDRPFGTARQNGPFGIPSYLPFEIGTPNNGGAIVTGSGLVFIAAATDNLIRAIDLRTGETIWKDVLPAGGQATPMTYEHDGRQYVVIMAGGHHFMQTPIGDALVAYVLPREETP